MSITTDIIDRTIKFEGSIDHMYLDITGRVTIGVGHMIPSATAASNLKFKLNTGGGDASSSQKSTEWTTIHKCDYPHPASHYKQFTTMVMSGPDIKALLKADLQSMETQLKAVFGEYDVFPAKAQAGLIDMAFNLGVNGVVTKFPKFTAAVKAKNWTVAANECKRDETQVQPARNVEVRKLFLDAASTT